MACLTTMVLKMLNALSSLWVQLLKLLKKLSTIWLQMAKKWVLFQFTCIVHSLLNISLQQFLKLLNALLFSTALKNQVLWANHCSSMLNNASMAKKMLLLSWVVAMVLLLKTLLLLKLSQYLKTSHCPSLKINLL